MNQPATVAAVQAAVRACPPGVQLLVCGAGTKLGLSNPPLTGSPHATASVGLSGLLEYEPSEFTFTAWAGTPWRQVRELLAGHGQYLPFDPPLVERGATLGGTIAAGLSGPGRYRYGGARDF